MPLNNLSKKFLIVGGGAVGVSNALMLKQELEQTAPQLQCEITIVDPKGFIGAGITYWDKDNDKSAHIYLNNQPNERMITGPDDRDGYTNFLKEKHGRTESAEIIKKEFSSRIEFGEYINHKLWNSINDSKNANIKITHIQNSAQNITQDGGKLSVSFNDNSQTPVNADAVIVATGHQQTSHFTKTSKKAGFFASPVNVSSLQEHLGHFGPNKGHIAIIGGGQSMIDSVAAIDDGAYPPNCKITNSDNIHILSNSAPNFWPFIPQEHPTELDNTVFTPKFLTPEYITESKSFSFEALTQLLQREIQYAKENPIEMEGEKFSFGPEHIYAKLDTKSFAHIFKTNDEKGAFNTFNAHVKTLFSNPTPEIRYNMMKAYQKGGMQFHACKINQDDITQTPEGSFKIRISDEENIKVDTIINAASFARTAIDNNGIAIDPFLRNLHTADALYLNTEVPGHFAPGEQKLKGLYLADCPATSSTWGMEKFSFSNEKIIKTVISNHLEINNI